MSTPRPSISPLSNAYESTKNSPSLLRSGAMANGGGDAEDNEPVTVDDAEEKDDSSELSEPDDDDGDELLQPSDIRHAMRKDDIDSEAETERLDLTPRHAREAGDSAIGRTPSKLSKVAQQDDELSEPPSPLLQEIGAASSTSTIANGEFSIFLAKTSNDSLNAGKKRKRSDTLESPLSSEGSVDGESPRKRTGSFKKENSTEDNSRGETTEVAEDTTTTSKSTKSRKNISRRGGRLGRELLEARDTIETEEEAPEAEPEETVDAHIEEDPVQKSEAADAFARLAKQFTAFRDALINERLATVEKELALLEQPQSQHPEYIRMIACVQQRRVKQDRETRAFHHYRQVATQQKVLAERAQLHSQYFQDVREIREAALDTLGTSWYSIQRERRQGVNTNPDHDNRHVYHYNNKRSDLLRQQAKYNREVSILSGIAKHVGFPAAPDINGVEGDGLEDDLRAMRVSCDGSTFNSGTDVLQLAQAVQPQNFHHQQRQTASHDPRAATPQVVNPYLHRHGETSAASAERSAHERFIEQHAWARAPSNNYVSMTSTPNISHTPDWAHATGFRKPNLLRNHLDQSPGITPSATPVNSRPMYGNGVQDIPDSAEQMGKDFVLPGSSPLQVPKQRLNGNESNGWRNYSGTSTIDAPLGDTTREHDTYEAEQQVSLKRDFAREARDPRANIESGIQPFDSHSRPPIPASIFASEKPDMFRTTGFRPLEGSFASPAPSSVAGQRLTGS